ncbi:hypothetical protein LZ30DRAFT_137259 [Colletotrichum cereale]|nr:hypothetical protein LZ30DRAFT_137259 [Colletotrichum cereale]
MTPEGFPLVPPRLGAQVQRQTLSSSTSQPGARAIGPHDETQTCHITASHHRHSMLHVKPLAGTRGRAHTYAHAHTHTRTHTRTRTHAFILSLPPSPSLPVSLASAASSYSTLDCLLPGLLQPRPRIAQSPPSPQPLLGFRVVEHQAPTSLDCKGPEKANRTRYQPSQSWRGRAEHGRRWHPAPSPVPPCPRPLSRQGPRPSVMPCCGPRGLLTSNMHVKRRSPHLSPPPLTRHHPVVGRAEVQTASHSLAARLSWSSPSGWPVLPVLGRGSLSSLPPSLRPSISRDTLALPKVGLGPIWRFG